MPLLPLLFATRQQSCRHKEAYQEEVSQIRGEPNGGLRGKFKSCHAALGIYSNPSTKETVRETQILKPALSWVMTYFLSCQLYVLKVFIQSPWKFFDAFSGKS